MYHYSSELVEATREVFQTMIFLDVSQDTDAVFDGWHSSIQFTAMIGLGGTESGLIYLHFDEAFAIKSASSMLGMDLTGDRDSIIDAIGEIANMIGGSFKSKVMAFESYRLSLPSVIVGKDYKTHVPHGSEGRMLGFKSEAGGFFIQLVLKK